MKTERVAHDPENTLSLFSEWYDATIPLSAGGTITIRYAEQV